MEGGGGEGGDAVRAKEGGCTEKVALEVVVGDNASVNGGAGGEHEVSPIGGDDGVAVAGLGESERWNRAWDEEVENGRECGCADEDGRGTGVGEKVGGDGN